MPRRVEAENPENSLVRAFDRKEGVACIAPGDLFLEEYEAVPEELREIVNLQRGLPCDGGGVPGRWCVEKTIEGCYWGRYIRTVRSQRLGVNGPRFVLVKLQPDWCNREEWLARMRAEKEAKVK